MDDQIINNFFEQNKNNQFILFEEDIKKLKNGIFSIWSDFFGSSFLKYKHPRFGLKSGIYFDDYEIVFLCGKGENDFFKINFVGLIKPDQLIFTSNTISINNELYFKCHPDEIEFIKNYIIYIDNLIIKKRELIDEREKKIKEEEVKLIMMKFQRKEDERKKKEDERKKKEDERRIIDEENKKKEQDRLRELNEYKSKIINDLDKDHNGEVDIIDFETFNKLLSNNQKNIIEIDKNYIQKFVKISIYLKTKRSNTQRIFKKVSRSKHEDQLNERLKLLKNQIHTYELLVFHSINMVTSLVDSDLITFYEIYECFDQLGVFNSNWENEVSDKLTDIGDGIKDLLYSIYKMENKIVNSIDNLTYTSQDSFKKLTFSIEKQLESIDSSINYNNLLTGIQNFQMYKINENVNKINQNTKRIN